VPDDVLGQYLGGEEIGAFKGSGTGVFSITVYAVMPGGGV
jgi:arsenite methyltransferase